MLLSCYFKLRKHNTGRPRDTEVGLAVWTSLKFLQCHPLCEGGFGWDGLIPSQEARALVLSPLADVPQGTDVSINC